MNAEQFLEVINANRDMLGEAGELVNPEDTHPAAEQKGCPLRVVMMVIHGLDFFAGELFGRHNEPTDPSPETAAENLYLDNTFTQALAHGWDEGLFYSDTDGESWNYEFAGFLIGFTLRPPGPMLQLPAATIPADR